MSGNYFSKEEINGNPSNNYCDASKSFCVILGMINRVLKYCLVPVYPVCINRR